MPPFAFDPKFIRQAQPKSGRRTDYADTVVRGLRLRVSPSGAKSYAYVYHLLGRNYRVTLGTPSEDYTLARAREDARAHMLRVQQGQNPATEKRQARTQAVLTVGGLVDQMLEALTLRPTTAREWGRLADVELAPLRRRPAGQVSRSEVRLWLQRIGARSKSTAKHSLEVLRRAYSWAMDMELLPASPCAGLKNPYRLEPADRVLATLEVRALWRALAVLGTWAYPDAVRLLLLTGTRKDMVLGAKAEEFEGVSDGQGLCDRDGVGLRLGAGAGRRDTAGHEDRTSGSSRPIRRPEIQDAAVQARWTVPGGFSGRSKSGRPHVVPLSPQAMAVVRRRLAESDGGYLFPAWKVGLDQEKLDWLRGALSEGLSQKKAGQHLGISQSEVWRYARGIHKARPMARKQYMTLTSAWLRILKAATRWTLWGAQVGEDAVGPSLAPMPRWTIHDLRRTVATHMREDLRVERNVVALILGHAQTGGGGATHVYDRAELLAERRAALVSWGAWVESVAGGQRANVLPMRG